MLRRPSQLPRLGPRLRLRSRHISALVTLLCVPVAIWTISVCTNGIIDLAAGAGDLPWPVYCLDAMVGAAWTAALLAGLGRLRSQRAPSARRAVLRDIEQWFDGHEDGDVVGEAGTSTVLHVMKTGDQRAVTPIEFETVLFPDGTSGYGYTRVRVFFLEYPHVVKRGGRAFFTVDADKNLQVREIQYRNRALVHDGDDDLWPADVTLDLDSLTALWNLLRTAEHDKPEPDTHAITDADAEEDAEEDAMDSHVCGPVNDGVQRDAPAVGSKQ